jgi:hypothetical protein
MHSAQGLPASHIPPHEPLTFVRGRYTALFRVRSNAADVVAMAFEKLWILNLG